MNKIFDGKAAIVTGSGHGIGKAVAEAYASFGGYDHPHRQYIQVLFIN